MILVSYFSEDNVLSDEIKICYIFEFQSNENRAFRVFFYRTPGIMVVIKCKLLGKISNQYDGAKTGGYDFASRSDLG